VERHVVAKSAHRHGIALVDILHAFEHGMRSFGPDDEGFVMVIGSDRAGNLLEVGYIISADDAIVIVHAMRAQARYLKDW
jgi:hypothetical protein